jgi:hypothetical protein
MSEVLFKNRQLCIYYETCDRRILGSSNLDPKSELCQNIQERVRLPWCAVQQFQIQNGNKQYIILV